MRWQDRIADQNRTLEEREKEAYKPYLDHRRTTGNKNRVEGTRYTCAKQHDIIYTESIKEMESDED